MIKRLRRRFIASAMLAMLVVLTLTIGAINLSTYYLNKSRLDNVLHTMAENDGLFPANSTIGRTSILNTTIESPYQRGSFSVRFNQSGEITSTNFNNITDISQDVLITYARQAYLGDTTLGNVSHYRFIIDNIPDGRMIYFVDANHLNEITHTFIKNSIIVSLIGYFFTSILVISFSNRAIQPIVNNYHLQRRFISDAGHELKTPLAVIGANVEIIEMTQAENEWTQSIKRQVKRMSSLINELLKLSTMEEQSHIDRTKIIDFTKLVREAVDSFYPMATNEQVILNAKIDDMVTVRGDLKSLDNLISILIDNAIKYALEGAAIDIVLQSKGMFNAQLTISNPCENPPDTKELNNFFERFYRADKSRNRKSGGFGIGLSMAKAIVEAHKGKISAKCEGNVITFIVNL